MEPLTKLSIKITSPSFHDQGSIPSQYTCEGQNINPALSIEIFPEETKSFVLFVEDPDAAGGVFNHWIVWNIYPGSEIKENSVPGVVGKDSMGNNNYMGPNPPMDITDRYFFKVYALDVMLNDLKTGADP